MSLLFEWDTEKELLNIQKHGIDFETASHVFLDEYRIEYYNKSHSTPFEDRYITIGLAGKILTVVYTDRSTSLRIISARLATKNERIAYYYGDKNIPVR